MSLPTFSSLSLNPPRPAIVYPDSDGQPMAENTLQWTWMVMIKCGLDALFKDDLNIFVASDHLWYPVKGDPTIRQAPDVYVVFGRPKVHRGSYLQWEECGIAPQVVFEILSPGNRSGEMQRKFEFYERHGVEEYYVYDPQDGTLEGWLRSFDHLQPISEMNGWVSPRLRIRFELVDGELRLVRPDGQRFLSYLEVIEQEEEARLALQQQSKQIEKQSAQVERLAAQLRALGVEPDLDEPRK
jgi:Uma2 family endonuclease